MRESCFPRQGTMKRGFTLVELLVVMVIIIILISSVLVATSAVFTKARTTSTQSVLAVVQQAVEQFEREQKENSTLTKATQGSVRYSTRYGRFPPDELELFTPLGLPGSGKAGATLGVNGAAIYTDLLPPGDWPEMQFYPHVDPPEYNVFESRDLAAMIVAIELYSDTASAILDRIPNDNRHPGMFDKQGNPVLFLDRPDAKGELNDKYDSGDLQIRYIVDSWGMAIAYHAQRDFNPADPEKTKSPNHEYWNQASTEMIRLNDGKPIIFSYGPNGGEQFEKQWMVDDKAKASLIGDWMDVDDTKSRINHHLNADNIYANPALKEKLAEGIARR